MTGRRLTPFALGGVALASVLLMTSIGGDVWIKFDKVNSGNGVIRSQLLTFGLYDMSFRSTFNGISGHTSGEQMCERMLATESIIMEGSKCNGNTLVWSEEIETAKNKCFSNYETARNSLEPDVAKGVREMCEVYEHMENGGVWGRTLLMVSVAIALLSTLVYLFCVRKYVEAESLAAMVLYHTLSAIGVLLSMLGTLTALLLWRAEVLNIGENGSYGWALVVAIVGTVVLSVSTCLYMVDVVRDIVDEESAMNAAETSANAVQTPTDIEMGLIDRVLAALRVRRDGLGNRTGRE